MKTLDDVIKALECCIDPGQCCENDCPYYGCCGYHDVLISDAVLYLENYRESKEWLDLEKRNYSEAIDNCERAEAKYTQMILDAKRNDPLTWDALKKMVDQPIWLEEREMCDDPFEGNWRLIECVEMWKDDKETERIMVTGSEQESYAVYHNDIGEYWNAYRKERK